MNNPDTLKNGLSRQQVKKAREILSQVSLKALCEKEGIPIATIYNVLRDNSPRLDLLKQILDAANEQLKVRNQLLASIPAV